MARETTYSGNQVLGERPDPVELMGGSGLDQNGSLAITINDDGSVEIGSPAGLSAADNRFDANLAERVDAGALGEIAHEIIEGVTADLASRSGFIDNYNKGLDLLGLKIEESTTIRTQRRSVSRVGHPLLLEAVVRFQAQARAEMLPAAGPCKVATAGGSTEAQDQLASDLESDMNYFLTQIDKGFYPDFDRALFALGFGGNIFKKVYRDPLRRHPVSRSIQIEDFIVSEDAADIDDAQRVTHRFMVGENELKKLVHAGMYRDCDLGQAQSIADPTKLKQGETIGLASFSARPQDLQHEFYETYVDLDPAECGLTESSAPKGLPLPYVVTVAVAQRQVLSIRRNWRKGDPHYTKRRRFVHYGLIPSFGFLCLGFLHLLGNQTRALRAIWRIMIDAGMFSTFPGGMKAKGVRTDTNEIAPGPGEWVDVDIGPFDDIKSAFMAMPYKDLSPNLMQLTELIAQDSQRVGGIPEMEVGEGRTHVPVGTMMSLIEQATQTMASVHKRMHSAMQDELTLIKELFLEDPPALTRLARSPARQWELPEEFSNLDLIPASDPNIPAQVHRNMQATALVALAQGAPQIYDQVAVQRRVLKAIGINDWNTLIQPPPPQGAPPPDPAAMAKMAELQLKQKDLDFRQQDTQRKAAHELQQDQQDARDQAQQRQMDAADLASKQHIAEMKEHTAQMRFAGEFANRREDRQHDTQLELIKQHGEHANATRDRAHEAALAHADRQHEGGIAAAEIAQRHAAAMKPEPKPAPAARPAAKNKKD